MEFYVRNLGKSYEMFLQRQLKSGEALNLEDAFKGFCRDVILPNGRQIKAQYQEDQFDQFLDWVESLAVDKSKWEFVRGGTVKSKPSRLKIEKTAAPRIRTEAIAQREKDSRLLTPQQIAWLPFDDKTVDVITSWKTSKQLKYALKFVVNIHGQEKIRKLLEDRINELASVGG